VRGEFTINGRMFAVSGAIFYEVFTNGTFTNRGAVVTDGLPVSMAASATQLLLASGGAVYVYTLATNVLTLLPAATFTMPFTGANAYISLVGFSDGFFIALCANSGKWYVSKVLDATDWVTNGPTIVSVFPDNIVSMAIDHREVALFGVKQSVAYFNSGNIFPYDVVPGGFIEQGSIATYATSKLDNTVYWLAGDERGNGVAFKAQGYLPVRISNHAVENAWSKYPLITDARAYSYQDQGHSFYVLYFPSANGGDGATWVYDAATQMWHERAFLNVANGHFMAHQSQCHVFAFGKHLVGDWNSGKIYNMSINTFTDAGEVPIVRVRRAPHLAVELERMSHFELIVEAETGLGLAVGQGSDPQAMLRWSNDGGHSWSNSYQASAGKIGQYKTRLRWSRLGQSRDRVYELSASDPIPWRIIDAYSNSEPGYQPSERLVHQYRKSA